MKLFNLNIFNSCKKISYAFILVVFIVLFCSCERDTVEMNELFYDFLDTTQIKEEVLQVALQDVNEENTDADLSLDVIQTITYEGFMCILAKISYPDDIILESNFNILSPAKIELYDGDVSVEDALYKTPRSLKSNSWHSEIIKVDKSNNTVIYKYMISLKDVELMGRTVSLVLSDFKYLDSDNVNDTLVENLISVWTIEKVGYSAVLDIDVPDEEMVGKVVITPFSVDVDLLVSEFDDMDELKKSIYLVFKDGTQLSLKNCLGSNNSNGHITLTYYFESLIDPENLVKVVIGDIIFENTKEPPLVFD